MNLKRLYFQVFTYGIALSFVLTNLMPVFVQADTPNTTSPDQNNQAYQTGQTVGRQVSSFGGLVPCGNSSGPNTHQCTLQDFIVLIRNVITALMVLSIPLATIAFIWIGFILLTAQGNAGKISRAKEIAWKVLWGFIFILSAWLIVYTITRALLGSSFPNFLTPS